MKTQPKKVVVILSGGIDSTTLLYDLKQAKDDDNNHLYNIVGVLSFDYGQKHSRELIKAAETCKKLELFQQVISLDFMKTFKSALTSEETEVPEGHYEDENMKQTVVPNRNMIMLSIATGFAVSMEADLVAYGAHAGDHFIYPDCRPEFVEAMNSVTKIANFQSVELLTPYLNITKDLILERGIAINVPFIDTWTCYKGQEKACGVCGSCQERLMAFKAYNLEDPLDYVTREIIEKK